MSALLGESESQPSHWVEIAVPPREDEDQHLQLIHTDNLTTTVAISTGVNNQNCKVSVG